MIIRVETQKGERAAVIAHHIVVVFRNDDGSAAVSLSNGEVLDLADKYSDLMQKLTHTLGHSCKKWPEDCYEKEREGWRVSQRLAIAAALNAWPGCRTETEWFTSSGDYWEPAIILPLPTGDGQ